MTYAEALAEAQLRPNSCSNPALMAQWLATNTKPLIGAASPELIWNGAQKQGMTAEALAELTHRDPMAAAALMFPPEEAPATSTDPEAHSIHLTSTHMPTTIEPANIGTSCSLCYESYKDGDWELLLPEARNRRDEQLTMCLRCAKDIGAAVASFPAGPAPWVAH